jgi:LuxR family maltose regulon positive regulatory protein
MTIGWHALDFNSGMSYESIALHLTENDPANRYIVLGSMGYLQMIVGHPLQAEPLLREAVELARQSGNAHAELAMMFAVSIARNLIPNGRINQALSMLTQYAVDAEVNGVRIPGTSNIAIANVSIDRHDLKTAEKELDIARASIRRSGIEFASTFYWQAMINLRLAQNNLGAANSLSIDMADWCKRNGNDGWLRTAQTLNAYVQLERGQTEDIGRWLLAILDLSAIDIEFRDEPRYLLFARWALIKAVNDNDDTYVTNAAAFTERIAEQATQDGRVLDAGIANVLFAALLTRLNRVDDALMLLDKTAAVLLPESVIRPFLVYASSILACFSASNLSLAHYPGLVDVKRIIEEHTDTDIANRPTPADQLQILSEREQEVLNLLAMGMINSEIADSLVVSLNTVKTHIKNIYFKLDAHSRTQVIGRARDYNLL